MLEKFRHPISYHLMIQPDVAREHIRTIMAHPIALEQCSKRLNTHYRDVEKKSGTGDFLDIGRWAEEIPKWNLDPSIALLWPAKLWELYGLTSIDTHLEDQSENFTYFLWIKR